MVATTRLRLRLKANTPTSFEILRKLYAIELFFIPSLYSSSSFIPHPYVQPAMLLPSFNRSYHEAGVAHIWGIYGAREALSMSVRGRKSGRGGCNPTDCRVCLCQG